MGNYVVGNVEKLDKYKVIVDSRRLIEFAKIRQEKEVRQFMACEKMLTKELSSTSAEFIDSHEISTKISKSLCFEKKIKAASYLIK